MKVQYIWFFFCISIALLLVFQTLWLLNTYQLEKRSTCQELNRIFSQSVKDEVRRRIEIEKAIKDTSIISVDKYLYVSNEFTIPDEAKIIGEFEINDVEGFEAGYYQQLLDFAGIPFSLNILDSIFDSKLEKSNLKVKYLIKYNNANGNLINQVGDSIWDNNLFKTESHLIINGNYVESSVDINSPIIFKRMSGILIISILMLSLIMGLLIYQIKFIRNNQMFNILREDFANALTHDLKSPLNTIYITLSNYSSGKYSNNPDFLERTNKIAISQILQIQSLVEKMLTIARIEENKLKLELVNIDIESIINTSIETFSLITYKNIEFRTTFNLNNEIIFADKTLLYNSINNLIDNAIKYSNKDVMIKIDCYTLEKKLYIAISDNGCGISLNDQQVIFNKYERGSAIKQNIKGFGLGLNYVKQVIAAHHGSVSLYSIMGRGSKFTIVIPLDIYC